MGAGQVTEGKAVPVGVGVGGTAVGEALGVGVGGATDGIAVGMAVVVAVGAGVGLAEAVGDGMPVQATSTKAQVTIAAAFTGGTIARIPVVRQADRHTRSGGTARRRVSQPPA
jgi:hypothetical protein